jgi:hypothetical protein
MGWTVRGSNRLEARVFLFPTPVQTGPGAHPQWVSGPYPGGKTARHYLPQVPPRLRISRAIPLLPHMPVPSWQVMEKLSNPTFRVKYMKSMAVSKKSQQFINTSYYIYPYLHISVLKGLRSKLD